jgi:hypothetical protein
MKNYIKVYDRKIEVPLEIWNQINSKDPLKIYQGYTLLEDLYWKKEVVLLKNLQGK